MKVFINGVLYDDNDAPIVLVFNTSAEAMEVGDKIKRHNDTQEPILFMACGESATRDDIMATKSHAIYAINTNQRGVPLAVHHQQLVRSIPNTKHTSVCLANAKDDEPVFVLRAKDPLARETIDTWMRFAKEGALHSDKIKSALVLQDQMAEWRKKNVK